MLDTTALFVSEALCFNSLAESVMVWYRILDFCETVARAAVEGGRCVRPEAILPGTARWHRFDTCNPLWDDLGRVWILSSWLPSSTGKEQ
jgi:hypothetical protein